jgi:hypothetical protein
MNLNLAFTWEDAKELANLIIFKTFQEYLKDVEIELLQGSWEGLTYEKMADTYHHSVNYLRGDVGPKLWHKLSVALAEEVTKNNFKGALERTWKNQYSCSTALGIELPFPEGSVPLNSPFYMERDGIESLCYETITQSGSLIRIKAPALMGKTSLITRILAHAQSQDCQSVYINLGSVERSILTNLDKFLRWLCWMVSRQLQVENKLNHYWDTEILGSNDNCTVYFEEYLLTLNEGSLVLGLDEVDRLFPCTDVVEDFLGMLRSWHEKGKISPKWRQFSLAMAHSTEVYIPLNMNQSPFNAGVPVELMEFEHKQVKRLAHLHHLNWNDTQVENLMEIVGGHPYLVRLAMYEVSSHPVTLDQLLQDAPTEAGIYSNHLRRHLETLQRESPEAQALKQSLKEVVTSAEAVELDSMQIYKLHSMGLVRRLDNHVIPRCNLYREYFRRVLS